MAQITSKELDLAKIVTTLEGFGYPVFSQDIGKDEVEANPSFFIYYHGGDINVGTMASQYLRDFTVMFVTRDNARINEVEVMESLRLCRLVPKGTEREEGRMLGTDEVASAVTFHFHEIIQVMR